MRWEGYPKERQELQPGGSDSVAAETGEYGSQGATAGQQRKIAACAAARQMGGLPLDGLSGGTCCPHLCEVCLVCGAHIPMVARLRSTAGQTSFRKERRATG